MVDISVLISVVVALVAVVGLVYTVFHFMYNEFQSVNKKISDLESSLGQRLKAVEVTMDVAMDSIKEQGKTYVELLMRISKPHNPHPDKEALLKRLYDGTITYEESTLLQSILEEEKRSAEASNDFIKVLIIVGVLAFLAIVLAELTKKK